MNEHWNGDKSLTSLHFDTPFPTPLNSYSTVDISIDKKKMIFFFIIVAWKLDKIDLQKSSSPPPYKLSNYPQVI